MTCCKVGAFALLVVIMAACALPDEGQARQESRRLVLLPAGLKIPGAYSTRRRYLGRRAADELGAQGDAARQYKSDQVLECQYFVDIPGLMLLLEDSSTVANLDAFQGVSLRVSVDGSGVASIESINVPDGREGGILTQRKTNEVALRAISMETEDPVEALLQGTATKPEPGSLVVQFGGFLDESNARWMELSVHEVESGVVLVSISEDGTLEFFTTSLSNDLTPLRR